MKVIKRDGREAEYDRNKIVHAIQKANNEVEKEDKFFPIFTPQERKRFQ